MHKFKILKTGKERRKVRDLASDLRKLVKPRSSANDANPVSSRSGEANKELANKSKKAN